MANPYYSYVSPVNSGETIRASKFNSENQSIEAAFDGVNDKLNLKIELPDSFAGTFKIPDVTLNNRLIYIDSDSNLNVYSLDAFDNDVATVANQSSTVNNQHNDIASWHTDIDAWQQTVNAQHNDVNLWHTALVAFDIDAKHSDMSTWHSEVNTLQQQVSTDAQNAAEAASSTAASEVNAATSEAAAAGYAATVGVPALIADAATYNVPENTSFLEMVCMGVATINLPATPGTSAKYIIRTTKEGSTVNINTNAGANTHDITFLDNTVDTSAFTTKPYELVLFWDGSAYLEGA